MIDLGTVLNENGAAWFLVADIFKWKCDKVETYSSKKKKKERKQDICNEELW